MKFEDFLSDYKKILTTLLFFLFFSYGFGAPPFDTSIKIKPPCKVANLQRAKQLQSKWIVKKLLAPPFFVTKTGTHNLLVIAVEFSDIKFDQLSTALSKFDDMKKFYLENSYGLLTLNISNAGPFTLPNQMSYYGADSKEIDFNIQRFIEDSFNSADSSVDFTQYDAYMILHSGFGQESLPEDTPRIWSRYEEFSPISKDGKNITDATIVPEKESGGNPLGVIVHEYGHQLGLPDLYDSNTQKSRVGSWSLMDRGTWLQGGSNPSHLDAWSKFWLGWLSPKTPTSKSENFNLSPIESDNSSIQITIPTANEYYLLEYRWTNSGKIYDRYLPASGLLIWHIDKDIAENTNRIKDNTVNTSSPHDGVDLVEADSPEIIGPTEGDGGDVFSSSRNSFTDTKDFSGNPSGISVVDIKGENTSAMTLNVVRYLFTQNIAINKVINYPNPAYDGKTTFQFQLTKPATPKLEIFDLAGILIKTVPSSQISIKGAKIDDYLWIYEYDWQGTDDSGDAVAGGVYIYRFTAEEKEQKEVKTGKLVIVK